MNTGTDMVKSIPVILAVLAIQAEFYVKCYYVPRTRLHKLG